MTAASTATAHFLSGAPDSRLLTLDRSAPCVSTR